MRLEGRSCQLRAQLRRAGHSQRITRNSHARLKCTIDYNCPPDWCHATRDVASASEVAVADMLQRRSVTMSIPLPFEQLARIRRASGSHHGYDMPVLNGLEATTKRVI